jgi:hypothetical protein
MLVTNLKPDKALRIEYNEAHINIRFNHDGLYLSGVSTIFANPNVLAFELEDQLVHIVYKIKSVNEVTLSIKANREVKILKSNL